MPISWLAAHFLDALLAGHGAARPLAGAGVGLGPLAAHRQTLAVPQAAVAADGLEAVDVLVDLAAQRPFHRIFTVENGGDARQLVVAQFLGPPLRIYVRLLAHPQRQGRP